MQRIPAAIIGGLADFRHTIGQCLAGFACQQIQQLIARRLDQIGGAVEHCGTMRTTGHVPRAPASREQVELGIDLRRSSVVHRADDQAPVGRVADLARSGAHAIHRPVDRGEQFRTRRAVGQIDAGGIDPVRIKIARQRNPGINGRAKRTHSRHGIGDDRLFRHGRIDQTMHEAGIGAVLQQPAHQIGEQVLMRADRRIDAHRIGRIVVQRLAHAVQALHLEPAFARAFQDEGQAVRVVRRERRMDRVAALQHATRAGEPAHIGGGLAGKHRIVGMALHLRQLDLAVPIGALHQTRRNAVARAPAQFGDPVDQRQRPLLIGLHGETEPIPARQHRVGQHGREDVQADLQPVGLLGIHGQSDIGGLRGERETAQRADERRNAASRLERLVARMQRRELDRDARSLARTATSRGAADGADRIEIGEPIALGVGVGLRRLAQHVKAVAQAPVDARQRLLDRAAHHELPRQHAHATAQCAADHWLAHPPDHAADDASRHRRAPARGRSA